MPWQPRLFTSRTLHRHDVAGHNARPQGPDPVVGLPVSGVSRGLVASLDMVPAPRILPVSARSAPVRARLGPGGMCAAGIAVAVAVTIQPASPAPEQGPQQPRRPAPARAHLGPSGRNAAGLASQIVTPLGTPGPRWRAQPRRPAPSRAVWHRNAGPAAVVLPAAQAYQRPPSQSRRPAPARGQWRQIAGPATLAPVILPPLGGEPGGSASWAQPGGSVSEALPGGGAAAAQPGGDVAHQLLGGSATSGTPGGSAQ